jgi:hypothetical protein
MSTTASRTWLEGLGMDLLFDQTLSISSPKLERIMQAVLFYADSVQLRATARIDGSDDRIERKIEELVEIGAVTTWAHEYEVTSGGRVSGEYRGWVGRRPVDRVLTVEDNRTIVAGVDEDLPSIGIVLTRTSPICVKALAK